MAGVKVRVLLSLCRFKVRAHIKNRVLFESVALVYRCIQECYFIMIMICLAGFSAVSPHGLVQRTAETAVSVAISLSNNLINSNI